MRINVYAEELTDETELVTKTVNDSLYGRRTFFGVRVYLKSPPELHADPEDNDRSAITFWVPWTKKGGHDFQSVEMMIQGLRRRLDDAQAKDYQGVGTDNELADYHRQPGA